MNQLAKPRRLLRFGLRTLLVLITVVSIWLGWKSHRARQDRLIVESIQSDGYMVYYSLDDPTKNAVADETWYSRVLGSDFYADVVGVEGFSIPNLGADRLRSLADMDSLEYLRVSFTDLDEDSLKAISEMSKLRVLTISAPDSPPEYLNHLTKLENLERLSVTRPVGDDGVAILAKIKSLKNLTISSDTLTQEGIQQLAALKNLERLKLRGNLDVTWETKQALGKVGIHDGSFKRSFRSMAIPLSPPITVKIDETNDEPL